MDFISIGSLVLCYALTATAPGTTPQEGVEREIKKISGRVSDITEEDAVVDTSNQNIAVMKKEKYLWVKALKEKDGFFKIRENACKLIVSEDEFKSYEGKIEATQPKRNYSEHDIKMGVDKLKRVDLPKEDNEGPAPRQRIEMSAPNNPVQTFPTPMLENSSPSAPKDKSLESEVDAILNSK